MAMKWDRLKYTGKPTGCVKDDKALYPGKRKRRLSKDEIQRKRAKHKAAQTSIRAEKARQKLLLKQFAWKDEQGDFVG